MLSLSKKKLVLFKKTTPCRLGEETLVTQLVANPPKIALPHPYESSLLSAFEKQCKGCDLYTIIQLQILEEILEKDISLCESALKYLVYNLSTPLNLSASRPLRFILVPSKCPNLRKKGKRTTIALHYQDQGHATNALSSFADFHPGLGYATLIGFGDNVRVSVERGR
jgi:hypothetical protein